MENSSKRKSNIELLRIVAMLLIIMFHYVYKSGYKFVGLNSNSFIVKSFWFFGELGVNLFILITGYFLVNGKFSIKKLICLIAEVNFYYIASVLIATRIGIIQPFKNPKDIFLMFFPIIMDRYWFITVYVLAYIISPYLNIFIHKMNKREHQKLLLILITLWSILPTFFGIFQNSTEKLLYYNRFIWFIVMYFVGAYIRLYSLKIFDKIKNAILISIISYGLMLLSIAVIFKFKNIFENLGTTEFAYFWPPNTFLMFMLSVGIFEVFLKLKINSNIIINKLASTTLAIYMLHDGVFNHYLWNRIFMAKDHLSGNFSIFWIVISAVIIYLIGSIIDFIRQIIEKYTIKILLETTTFDRFIEKTKKIGNKIFEIM